MKEEIAQGICSSNFFFDTDRTRMSRYSQQSEDESASRAVVSW